MRTGQGSMPGPASIKSMKISRGQIVESLIRRDEEPGADLLRPGLPLRRGAPEQKVYINYLVVSQLSITLSFLPADWRELPAAQRGRSTHLAGAAALLCSWFSSLALMYPACGTALLLPLVFGSELRPLYPTF